MIQDIQFDGDNPLFVVDDFTSSPINIYRLNVAVDKKITLMNIYAMKNSDGETESGIIYYTVIDNCSNLILNSDGNIPERTFIESHVDIKEDASKNILDTQHHGLKTLRGGYGVSGRTYIIILYVNEEGNRNIKYALGPLIPVSYTHLTLPTIYSV